ncbi:hypothetical protein AMTR_s00052p00227700 [Amborella trichopoda]|uniref:Uncharacterized protein n=1 Tax=Amborella trichopoda TaxID=13333 RepID=U5D233_AMBTC|nr:hypothetical protein AMTR_s00052p00227700 [Amborella trichopoda]
MGIVAHLMTTPPSVYARVMVNNIIKVLRSKATLVRETIQLRGGMRVDEPWGYSLGNNLSNVPDWQWENLCMRTFDRIVHVCTSPSKSSIEAVHMHGLTGYASHMDSSRQAAQASDKDAWQRLT